MGDANKSQNFSDTPSKAYVHSLPSDYSDVQDEAYDAEYISAISSKMQVPDKLGVTENREESPINHTQPYVHNGMTVPDRILISEGGEHVGARGGLRQFDFEKNVDSDNMQYVGLITPPRTLTLEESFPTVEPQLDDEEDITVNKSQSAKRPNGEIGNVDSYTPGASLNESVLMNEADEITKLQIQMRKLNRKLDMIESNNRTLMNGFKYAGVAFFMWTLIRWFLHRSSN